MRKDDHVDRGEQGRRRTLVHRVLGTGVQRGCHRRARRTPTSGFEYSLHAPLLGRDQVRDLAIEIRAAFPDLAFAGTADLIGEGDYVVGQWIGGPQADKALDDMRSSNS